MKYVQKLQQKEVEVAEEVAALFAGELNPVAPKAQKKVPVPEGSVPAAAPPPPFRPGPALNRHVVPSLDLDAWINEPPSESESEDEKPKAAFAQEEPRAPRPRHSEVDEEELARVRSPCQLLI